MATEATLHFRAAYDRHLPDMQAIEARNVKKVNLDIPTAGQTVLGVVVRLGPFREALVALSGVSSSAVDQLESRTRAMVHAHTEWTFASTPVLPIAELVADGMAARGRLELAARLLAAYGYAEAARVGELRGGLGHRNLAMDLLGLATLLRPLLARLDGSFLVTAGELDDVEQLGERILSALGERQQRGPTATEASQLRDRAFTLFIDAYAQVQRGMAHLRWVEGDAKAFTPSLYGGKGRRRAGKAAGSVAPGAETGESAGSASGGDGKGPPPSGSGRAAEHDGPFVTA